MLVAFALDLFYRNNQTHRINLKTPRHTKQTPGLQAVLTEAAPLVSLMLLGQSGLAVTYTSNPSFKTEKY